MLDNKNNNNEIMMIPEEGINNTADKARFQARIDELANDWDESPANFISCELGFIAKEEGKKVTKEAGFEEFKKLEFWKQTCVLWLATCMIDWSAMVIKEYNLQVFGVNFPSLGALFETTYLAAKTVYYRWILKGMPVAVLNSKVLKDYHLDWKDPEFLQIFQSLTFEEMCAITINMPPVKDRPGYSEMQNTVYRQVMLVYFQFDDHSLSLFIHYCVRLSVISHWCKNLKRTPEGIIQISKEDDDKMFTAYRNVFGEIGKEVIKRTIADEEFRKSCEIDVSTEYALGAFDMQSLPLHSMSRSSRNRAETYYDLVKKDPGPKEVIRKTFDALDELFSLLYVRDGVGSFWALIYKAPQLRMRFFKFVFPTILSVVQDVCKIEFVNTAGEPLYLNSDDKCLEFFASIGQKWSWGTILRMIGRSSLGARHMVPQLAMSMLSFCQLPEGITRPDQELIELKNLTTMVAELVEFVMGIVQDYATIVVDTEQGDLLVRVKLECNIKEKFAIFFAKAICEEADEWGRQYNQYFNMDNKRDSCGIWRYDHEKLFQTLKDIRGLEEKIANGEKLIAKLTAQKQGSAVIEKLIAERQQDIEKLIAERQQDIEKLTARKQENADNTDIVISIAEKQKEIETLTAQQQKAIEKLITERKKGIEKLIAFKQENADNTAIEKLIAERQQDIEKLTADRPQDMEVFTAQKQRDIEILTVENNQDLEILVEKRKQISRLEIWHFLREAILAAFNYTDLEKKVPKILLRWVRECQKEIASSTLDFDHGNLLVGMMEDYSNHVFMRVFMRRLKDQNSNSLLARRQEDICKTFYSPKGQFPLTVLEVLELLGNMTGEQKALQYIKTAGKESLEFFTGYLDLWLKDQNNPKLERYSRDNWMLNVDRAKSFIKSLEDGPRKGVKFCYEAFCKEVEDLNKKPEIKTKVHKKDVTGPMLSMIAKGKVADDLKDPPKNTRIDLKYLMDPCGYLSGILPPYDLNLQKYGLLGGGVIRANGSNYYLEDLGSNSFSMRRTSDGFSRLFPTNNVPEPNIEELRQKFKKYQDENFGHIKVTDDIPPPPKKREKKPGEQIEQGCVLNENDLVLPPGSILPEGNFVQHNSEDVEPPKPSHAEGDVSITGTKKGNRRKKYGDIDVKQEEEDWGVKQEADDRTIGNTMRVKVEEACGDENLQRPSADNQDNPGSKRRGGADNYDYDHGAGDERDPVKKVKKNEEDQINVKFEDDGQHQYPQNSAPPAQSAKYSRKKTDYFTMPKSGEVQDLFAKLRAEPPKAKPLDPEQFKKGANDKGSNKPGGKGGKGGK